MAGLLIRTPGLNGYTPPVLKIERATVPYEILSRVLDRYLVER